MNIFKKALEDMTDDGLVGDYDDWAKKHYLAVIVACTRNNLNQTFHEVFLGEYDFGDWVGKNFVEFKKTLRLCSLSLEAVRAEENERANKNV